jgi:hypothetical protein
MPDDDLLRLRRCRTLPNPPNVQRPILPVEAAHTTHIVSVISELVSREAVFGGIGHGVVRVGKDVSILALPAIRTASSRKEEADVFVASGVGACEACVFLDVAAGLGFYFAVEGREGVRI